MALQTFLETRSLKRPRLGPPDVYPQDPKQKEDELTSLNVKQGFLNPFAFRDECATAHQFSFDVNKITQSFNNILTQKQIFNTFNDAAAVTSTNKKRPPVTKENFWPLVHRSHFQTFFKELSGSKPLFYLSKKVPGMNKKEDVFQTLAEHEVPLVRASWFIKMTSMFYQIQTEAKSKKKITFDPNTDWSVAICKFMKEQLARLNDDNSSVLAGGTLSTHVANITTSFGTGSSQNAANAQIPRADLEKQLKYIGNLAHHMFTEGLFERQDILTWVVEVFESISMYDEIALSYFMPFILQYIEEVSLNLLLSRRMCFVAARHLNWIYDGSSSRSGSPTVQSGRNTPCNRATPQPPVSNGLPPTEAQLKQRVPERLLPIAHTLSCIIQCTALTCTGALVWYPPRDPKQCGSPLDLLPCTPSALLLPDISEDDLDTLEDDRLTRLEIKEKEAEIIRRSLAAEMRWSSDKCQESTAGHTINRVLASLEALDKQNFDKGDPVNLLYPKIFDQSSGKDNSEMQLTKSSEDAVIGLLCEWAITAKRLGEHRASVVAKLLDLRQAYYEQDQVSDVHKMETNCSNPHTSNQNGLGAASNVSDLHQNVVANSTPYFQSLLFTFLDTQAPELKDPDDADQLQTFKNLILLFTELIEHDVFSYTQYVNTLISRGDISPGQISSLPIYVVPTPQSSNSLHEMKDNNQRMDVDDVDPSSVRSTNEVKLDTDIDFLAPESVFSPESHDDRHFMDAVRPLEQGSSKPKRQAGGSGNATGAIWGYNQPRHIQYVTHFPIPVQDESSNHEWNQRLMVLYGAGRQKSDVKRAVRKVTRHLTKLVQSKRDMDEKQSANVPAAWASGNKKSRRSNKSSHSELLCRYKALSFFDQHMITSNVAKTLLQTLNNYMSGRNALPRLDVVMLLFDLMEEALNIGGLVRLAVSVSRILAPLADEIQKKKNEADSQGNFFPTKHTWYCAELSLSVVSVLRHYQSYLTLNNDLALEAFGSLLAVTRKSCISNPAQCTSPDRSILLFLYELYVSFAYIRVHHLDSFGSYVGNVKQALCSIKKPATSNCRYDPLFMQNFIENPSAQSALSVAEGFSDQLHDTTCRYSFVCTVITTICSGQQDFEKINALAALCAEMNARCNELSAEWLGVLKALCCSTCTANFNDVLLTVEVSDSQIRDPLALFTAVLIARGCLSLEDVIKHVAIPSLLAACNSKPGASLTNPNTGARLTCHLLLQLFKSPNSPNTSFRLPSSADRHLLAAAQHNTAVGAVLAVLKAVLKLGDAGLSSTKSSFANDSDVSVATFFAPIGDFGNFDMPMSNTASEASGRQIGGVSSMDSANLSDFAKHAVRVICAQQWVRERCLKEPVMDLLMDQVLTREQRQNLIQLICYPEEDLQRLSSLSGDLRGYVVGILSSMTRWTLRQCLLELQVMLRQPPQEKSLPEHIAKATIEVFQQQQQQQLLESAHERKSSLTGPELDRCNVWLVAPLVSKLPSQVQGRVLQEASAILDAPLHLSSTSTRSGTTSRADRGEQRQGCSSLLNHQPFLTLILTCLKGQDEQRDSLLESLQSQIIMLHSEWTSVRNQRDAGKDVSYMMTLQDVHEALQLRLSLVGGMFDTVQSNSTWTSNVAVLLTQLISSGMVDAQVNVELFDIVFDMIAVLLHHTLGGDTSRKREYSNIVKKMKKVISERQTESTKRLRQLMPVPRAEVFIVCCEPSGPHADVKGGKIPSDGAQGLQVTTKQKLNAWEIIEGLKQPAPLCFAWFGSRKTERKALRYEQQQVLMLHHQHGDKKYRSEFLAPPQLPPEEEEEPVPPPPKSRDIKPSSSKQYQSQNTSTVSKADEKRPSKSSKTKRSKKIPKVSDPSMSIRQAHSGMAGLPVSSMSVGGSMLKSFPSQPQVSNYPGYGQNNPNLYSNYQPGQQATHNQMTGGAYQSQPASGFHSVQQPVTQTRLKQHLRSRLQARQDIPTRPVHTSNQQPYGIPNSSDVRLKLEGYVHRQQVNVHQPRTMSAIGNFSNPQSGNISQQNQQHSMTNYNSGVYRQTQYAQPNHISYQQTNVGSGQPGQQYISHQQQNTSYGMGNMSLSGNQGTRTYGNQQSVQQTMSIMGRQGQSQAQSNIYGVNQVPNRGMNITRMTQQQTQLAGGRVHTMGGGNAMQQGGNVMNQQMMGQQQQQQQYRQPMQQQATQMMEMRRTIHQPQGPY